MATLEKEAQTFAAFEGKVSGNTVKGVSLLQKGPALGHGVWIDDVTLSQAKKCATDCGKLKAKQNHWSGIEDTIGYYENFRVRDGKLTADLTLFNSHPGSEQMLEMIDTIPHSFGVSISFMADSPEYDKENDRYNARVRQMLSADFVDTPAANRDGVFEAQIDSGENDMPTAVTPPDAFDAKAAIAALETKFSELTSALEALKPKEPVAAPPAPAAPPAEAQTGFTAQQLQEAVTTALKVHFAAPPTNQAAVPPNEPDAGDPMVKTAAEFRALPQSDRNAFMAKGGKLKL